MPRLPNPQNLSFNYVANYSEAPLLPVIFSHRDNQGLPVLCLVDSGASGVVLPMELAEHLGVRLATPSRSVIGVSGITQGWVQALTATFPDLDNLSFPVEAIFLPELPIALMGRDPFFQRLHVAFQHSRRDVYLEPA